ncbi:MAG TPA: Ig domain-containing protein [Anaeromyxobacter sp.]|nr:Ig domain-containing protein [Anaeromyxobacter sp.]
MTPRSGAAALSLLVGGALAACSAGTSGRGGTGGGGGGGGTLTIATTGCPAATQGQAYACTIEVSGGTPPYAFSVASGDGLAPLPEGMSLGTSSGVLSSALVGGQGSYGVRIHVADAGGQGKDLDLTLAVSGSNAWMAQVFPASSIFHHRVDAATTNLPVDGSPAAPIYIGYQGASLKVFFGAYSYLGLPTGIPAIAVPDDQAIVPVATTLYQHYFTSGPIPSYAPVEGTAASSDGDRHVLVYRRAGGGLPAALYEMWQGSYLGAGGWTDSSNALWPDVSTNALTAQGKGTSDAAGLPVAPLLLNADEVIGAGTPQAPSGAVRHPVRFTTQHTLNYWVWPGTECAGVGSCNDGAGSAIETGTMLSQSSPPGSCTMTGPMGEIYRLKASVPTPGCATTSPQAAIIIQGFRDYGIILADNGSSGGLIGTPDARWNDDDLGCLTQISLGDFEPVDVSSLMVSAGSGETSK